MILKIKQQNYFLGVLVLVVIVGATVALDGLTNSKSTNECNQIQCDTTQCDSIKCDTMKCDQR